MVRPSNIPAPFPADQYSKQIAGSWPSGSLKEYYEENSRGKLSLSADVTNWIALPNEDSYYEGDCDFEPPGNCTNPQLQQLIDDAVRLASIHWPKYDSNSDGFVDTLVVVHAEEAGQCSRGSSNFQTSEFKYFNEAARPSYLDTGQEHQNGIRVCINEIVLVSGVGCSLEHIAPMSDLAHELGHALGLPDLEDQDFSGGGVGRWDLMGLGGFDGNGNPTPRPSHLSAWAKAELGWIAPLDLSTPGSIVLQPIEGSGEVYRFRSAEDPEDVYLLENRQRIGFDSDLPGSGLLVWRANSGVIDRWKKRRRTNEIIWSVNDDDSRKGLELIEADGRSDLVRRLGFGDASDTFPGSENVRALASDTTPRLRSGHALCKIRTEGSTIQLEFSPTSECP